MKRNLIFLLGGAGFLFVSCLGGGGRSAADSSRTSQIVSLPLVGTHWYLHEMDGQMREMLGADSMAFTLVLSDTTNLVAGCGACNRFFGEYNHALDSLSFRIQGRTQMFCPGLDVEDRYLQMLDSVKSYCIYADTLRLYDCRNWESAVFIGR